MGQRFTVTYTIDLTNTARDAAAALRDKVINSIDEHIRDRFMAEGSQVDPKYDGFVEQVHREIAVLHQFTVVGYWEADSTRTAVAAMGGDVSPAMVFNSDVDAFGVLVWASDPKAARDMVNGTTAATTF